MDHESQVAIPPWLNAEAISEFIDELRLAGYKIGVDQHIAVQKLLLALIARGVQFTEPIQLINYLGPVICTSPAEQQDFQNRFTHWIVLMDARQGNKPDSDAEAVNSLTVELQTIEREWLWFRRSLVVIVLLIVAFLPISAMPDPKRLESTIPIHPTVTSTLTVPVAPLVGGDIVSDTTTLTIPALQVAPIPLFRWNIWYALGLVLLTLLLLTIVWRRWWFYRAELFLERHARTTQPEIEKVSVQGLREQIFDDRLIFSVAQAFRRRVEKPIPMLDVERTLNRSLAQGGWFAPVFDRRQIRPEYLFLVDRTNYQDQQAKLAETLIHSLQEYDVLAVIYYFDGDPRLCVAATSERAWSLPELVNKYEGYRLILFTDGAQFFHPLSGEFEPWIEYLQRWAIRVILTPVAPARWHYREKTLAECFSLLPATADGLAQFMQVTPAQTTILAPTEQMNASYPTELEARPLIWIQRDPPEITQIDDMLIALRQYLGIDGFYWLSACAIYPALNWNLTLYLGATLRGEDGGQLLEMRRLADLIHLPWFRYGYIPDWLRIRLLIDLVPEQDHAIRSTLEALLITAIRGETDEFQLEIARDHQWTIAMLVKPLLHILAKNASVDSPLHDYVFLTFMAGRWQKQLALRAPDTLHALFINRRQQILTTNSYKYVQDLEIDKAADETQLPNSLMSASQAELDNQSQEFTSINSPAMGITQSIEHAVKEMPNESQPSVSELAVLQQGRYRIKAPLTQGGMGTVYLATDRNLSERRVVIKENLGISPGTQKQFQREAMLLARLSHPNLPRVTDHFIEPSGRQYLVMDYINGENLREIIQARNAPLTEAETLKYIEQVMIALEYMHGWIDSETGQPSPIIHRNIEPGNIKRMPDGRIVLVDFGLAQYHTDAGTQLAVSAITPGYLPTEQYTGGTDVRSDIYALGATLYTLLTGHKPPASFDLLNGAAQLALPRAINPKISRKMEQVILKAMQLAPPKRYQSITEMRQALGFVSSRPTPLLSKSKLQWQFTWSKLMVIGLILVFFRLNMDCKDQGDGNFQRRGSVSTL
jgi:hypothetical protein